MEGEVWCNIERGHHKMCQHQTIMFFLWLSWQNCNKFICASSVWKKKKMFSSLGRRGLAIGLTACAGVGATALFVSLDSDHHVSASGITNSSKAQFAGLDDERRYQLHVPKLPYPQWDDNWYFFFQSRTDKMSFDSSWFPFHKICFWVSLQD